MKKKPDVGLLVFTDRKTLAHKRDDGLREHGEYVFWYGSRIPKKILDLLPEDQAERQSYSSDKLLGGMLEDDPDDLRNYDIRIYFQTEGTIWGYFKVSAIKTWIDKKGFEIRFWSDDWVAEEQEGRKGHQGWEYYPK